MGTLLFLVPVIVILALILVAVISGSTTSSGVLVVTAQSSFDSKVALHVSASVGGVTRTTPFNLSLDQGEYTVSFGALAWYSSPLARSITLTRSSTEFAIGVYKPITRVISITTQGFNQTDVSALHEVTPVVWINEMSSLVRLDIQGLSSVAIQPSENFTHVFVSAGTVSFTASSSTSTGYVTVV